jgi:cell division protein FtsB
MLNFVIKINASLKADKEGLESALYEAQQQVAQLESRKEQLEAENQELLIRKESTQAELNRLHKELETEIEKAARQRETLNQKFLIFEQESQARKLQSFRCIT